MTSPGGLVVTAFPAGARACEGRRSAATQQGCQTGKVVSLQDMYKIKDMLSANFFSIKSTVEWVP